MPRTKGVNKTQAVRDYLRAHRNAKTRTVVEGLAAEGIAVTAQYVSKIKGTPGKRGRRAGAAPVTATPSLGIPEVKAALALIKACGSPRAAKKALAAAIKIRALV